MIPEKPAFKFENESLSYEDLAIRANKLASVLIENGVKKGDRVGVFLKPSLETAVAIFGIMNAGAAYVPLDTNSPSVRISQILVDCGIEHIVSSSNENKSLKYICKDNSWVKSVIGGGEGLPVDSVSWNEVLKAPNKEPAFSLNEDDLAYVMYTSGTTGLPKGITHTHRSGLAYARLSKDLYGIDSNDVLGNHSPLHFDISTMGYFTIPLAGGTTVIIPEVYKKFPASLSQLIEQDRLTIWYSVPLALIQMLERGGLASRNLDKLRWILFGGEPFPVKHLRKIVKLIPKAKFSNVYGPAEVNQCTFYNFSDPPMLAEPLPLGKAWDETEIILVDEDDTEVGPGETGEILVRTPTMMKGYWKQAALTESALMERNSSEVFYRTGDLAKENLTGELIFLGRKDRQVKLRGYRVELDEIEFVLSSHANLSEAAVFIFRDDADDLKIFASVIAKIGSNVSAKSLDERLGKRLPPYVKIEHFEFVEDLPRTSAGKVDHKKLEQEARKKYISETSN